MGMIDGIRSFAGASARAMGFGGIGQGTRDAARHDLPEFSGWNPRIRFAGGGTTGRDFDTITGRARDLDENNGWINGGVDRRVESVIGVNIRLSAQPRYTLLNRGYAWRVAWAADVQDRFTVWANDIDRRCDARQRLTFGAMAKLAYLTYVRDGEIGAEIRDNKRGLANTTNILLIEPERISTPPLAMHTEGPLLRNGVKFDANGAAIGYYVRSGHPDDPAPAFQNLRWDYIPARGRTGRAKFVHVFSPRRVEQNRGISRLAEAMLPAKMIDRVDRAEVNAALKSAIFSMFIKSPGTSEDIEAALAPADDRTIDPWVSEYLNYREKSPVVVDGAQVVHLLPDEEMQFPDRSSPNANYPAFIKMMIRKVASSLGVATPHIDQDYSAINYSSARVMLNEIWRSFKEDRHFFCQSFLTPMYAAWLEVEVANGTIKVPGGPANFYRAKSAICMAEWIGPGRGSVDPLKEANANNLDTAAGRKSTVECILEEGRDPADVLAEESYYLEARAARGLPDINHNVKAAVDASNAEAANPAPNEEPAKVKEPA